MNLSSERQRGWWSFPQANFIGAHQARNYGMQPIANIAALAAETSRLLERSGFHDKARAHLNLRKLAESGIPADLYSGLLQQLERHLGQVSDPDMALNNLERFFAAARSPLALAALLDRDPTGIPILLRLFSTSQYLSDLLIRDRESYDFLRMTEGQPHTRDVLVDYLSSELSSAPDLPRAMSAIRRFKHRETLRIAFGDLIAERRLPEVAEQISFVAEAICQCAWDYCELTLQKKWGSPISDVGQVIACTLLALGKLGGSELNYSSDIDLIVVFREHGTCSNFRSRSAIEFFEELTRMFIKMLSEPTALGIAYRVDLRLRPEGRKGRLCSSFGSFLQYYEMHGRSWERQALIKARPVAGDSALGETVLSRLQPWIFARHLNRFDIGEVKALKRQIERRALVEGVDRRDIKTGFGGIRDIEFAIQFLQLLHGATLPALRTPNTLRAIEQLQRAGCLTFEEESLLTQNYIWLRKLEHRLQIMFDLQTHTLPEHDSELKKTALRMGYADMFGVSALDQFKADLAEVTTINRRILDHLLHDAFLDEAETAVPPEVDLLFMQDSDDSAAKSILTPFGFRHPETALAQLQAMSRETTPFLSSHRCKHFLAATVPRLLREIAATPDPDETIVSLRSVADSLGAKGVLWELFHAQPGALELFVRLCAGADYLTAILRNNPGMIDELADSLVMDHLPEHGWLSKHLHDLLGGSEDLDPIIHSFKQAQHLRVGVRELLGKTNVVETTRSLTDIADVCLASVAEYFLEPLRRRYGEPLIDFGQRPCGVAILALGKHGGRELGYHSDLDLIFHYEADGSTSGDHSTSPTSHHHFFSLWAIEVTKFVTQSGPFGRLYPIDNRLRPTGKSGSLVISREGLRKYFAEGQGQAWERLALCKARVVWSLNINTAEIESTIAAAINAVPWSASVADEIWQMRLKMQESASSWSLKRSAGGTVDVEFLVQMFMMKNLATIPELRTPSTLEGLKRIGQAGLIDSLDIDRLSSGYQFLRTVESRLQLASNTPEVGLAENSTCLNKLCYLLGRDDPVGLLRKLDETRRQNRKIFLKYLAKIQQSPS